MHGRHTLPADLEQTMLTGVTAEAARRLLAERAPKLLRELYERDVRRPFCPPALWLEPFHAAEAAAQQSAEERFSAAAVMRALLHASSGLAPGSPRYSPQPLNPKPSAGLSPFTRGQQLLKCGNALLPPSHHGHSFTLRPLCHTTCPLALVLGKPSFCQA